MFMFLSPRFFLIYSCFLCEILLRGQCNVQSTKRQFRNMVDTNEIKKNLRRFTKRPHPVASKGEELITDYIRDTWKRYGFEVEEPEYEVVLSFPQEDKPNKVSIINKETREVEREIKIQLNVTAGRGQDGTVYKYTPYSSLFSDPSTVEGDLVFGGRGSPRVQKQLDFDYEEVDFWDNILLISSRIENLDYILENKKPSGLIIYDDPRYFAKEGTGVNDTFPNKAWLPGDAVYSGIAVLNSRGDITTPVLPSTYGMRRLDIHDSLNFKPLIPIQSISYDDARYLLSRMRGDRAPEYVRGDLDVDYRLGPGLEPTHDNPHPVVKIEINNEHVSKKIRNVIATIPGSEEPDRYVLIGNHKDSITFGGGDASTGTAILMEISRVFWKLKQNGWRPRRTIKLCTWTGEEQGLIGSSEWVQENVDLLKKRAVAYFNIDNVVMGRDRLKVEASPLLGDVILNNAKELQDPASSSMTLFDSMFKSLNKSEDYPGEPHIYTMQLQTDHLPFLHLLGLSVANFAYFPYKSQRFDTSPIYHTQYDTFEWVERFADPNFRYSRLVAQFFGGMLLDLSDSEVLPFNVTRLAKSVQKAFKDLPNSVVDEKQKTYLERAVKAFVNMSNAFESAKSRLTRQQQKNPLVLRMLNDQMSGLEKTFYSPNAMRAFLFNSTSEASSEFLKSYEPKDNMLLIGERFKNINKIRRMAWEDLDRDEKKDNVLFEMSLIIQAVREATKLLKPLKSWPEFQIFDSALNQLPQPIEVN